MQLRLQNYSMYPYKNNYDDKLINNTIMYYYELT